MNVLEKLFSVREALVWKKNTTMEKTIQKMLHEVQIDGWLR